MDDEDFDETETAAGVARLNWTDPFFVAFVLAKGIADAFSDAARTAILILGAHSNWIVERQKFAEGAGRDIESLTGRSDA
jgi:hypothetical protein